MVLQVYNISFKFKKKLEFVPATALSPHLLLQGATVVKPVVYGNVARYFGKKREEDGHTHQWTVYVKPYRNEVSLQASYTLAVLIF